ncbi:hypothetical protein HPULCUR_004068 [Helicostylum pulchrum]|uniref:Uncharacterized protein n=1 Tax=Helicostylum pulchrum TaxID=562976 RepID=A0ABP9XW88_9FUNG
MKSLQDMKYSAIRSEAADVLNQLKKTGTVKGEVKVQFDQEVTKYLKNEPSSMVQSKLQQLLASDI